MSRHDYEVSKRLLEADPPFYALIMAAMRKADTGNLAHLVGAFPVTWLEMQERWSAPGGRIPGDPDYGMAATISFTLSCGHCPFRTEDLFTEAGAGIEKMREHLRDEHGIDFDLEKVQ